MKNLVPFALFFSFLIIFSNCEKNDLNNDTVSYVRSNQINERGRVDGVSLPLWRETCDKPNGFCYGSSIKVDWAIVDEILKDIGYSTVTVRTPDKIRFTNKIEHIINESVLLETIETELTSGSATEVLDVVMNNFNVAEETSFSEDDSKKLLKDAGLDGTQVTMLPGEYPIVVNNENPYGYFDIDIIIQ